MNWTTLCLLLIVVYALPIHGFLGLWGISNHKKSDAELGENDIIRVKASLKTNPEVRLYDEVMNVVLPEKVLTKKIRVKRQEDQQ